MNNLELQAARKLLMLDVSEAAEEIGNVSPRSWQYWETGQRSIPEDVTNEMYALLSIRTEQINKLDETLSKTTNNQLQLKYCLSFEQYQNDYPDAKKMQWRIQQSVAALYFTEGYAALI